MSNIKAIKIVVLVSGGGTNLKKIIEAVGVQSEIPISICAVIADRPAYALERAIQYDIPTYLFSKKAQPDQYFYDIDSVCQRIKPDIIVLAGFLGILPRWFTLLWSNTIINIHPSLLPKFGGMGMYGLNVHKAVVEAGEKETGCTIHWVSPEVDKGEIITQVRTSVYPDDTAEKVQARVLAIEHEMYPNTIIRLAKEICEKRRKKQ